MLIIRIKFKKQTDQLAGIVVLIRIAFFTPDLEEQYIFVTVCHISHTERNCHFLNIEFFSPNLK